MVAVMRRSKPAFPFRTKIRDSQRQQATIFQLLEQDSTPMARLAGGSSFIGRFETVLDPIG
jgi:hypothetical protein